MNATVRRLVPFLGTVACAGGAVGAPLSASETKGN